MRFQDAVKERYTRGLWNRYFVSTFNTYMAWPWTRLFVALRMTPNQVSILSLLVSLAGMAVIVHPEMHPALGAALLIIGIWWDHSDGQVARISKNGTLGGGLLDTVFDRWVETGWVLALGIGVIMGAPQATLYEPWILLAVTVLATHATLYVRWANIQKDLYLLQRALRRAAARTEADGRLETSIERSAPPRYDVRTFYIPFAFNRDVTLWMLFFITITPYWVEGLLLFALAHAARGLEMNWYTFQGLKKGDQDALARFLHPDYHK